MSERSTLELRPAPAVKQRKINLSTSDSNSVIAIRP